VNTCLQREYARAPRGKIIGETTRGKKFDRLNVIGALCNGEHSSIECYRHTANSAFFEDWFENKLLRDIPKGNTVIMDNARFHRKKELRKIARGKARLLFLPPYSPDYNQIEKTWANMKRFLRNNLHEFNSVDSAVYYYFGFIDN
jgi:transposase